MERTPVFKISQEKKEYKRTNSRIRKGDGREGRSVEGK